MKEWISLKERQPEKDKEVEIKFKNGMVACGKIEGGFAFIDPKLMSFDLAMSEPKAWRNKLIVESVLDDTIK